jgi:hypothetical protein
VIEDVGQFVQRTTEASHVPFYLEDEATIASLATLLAAARGEAAPRGRSYRSNASAHPPNPLTREKEEALGS